MKVGHWQYVTGDDINEDGCNKNNKTLLEKEEY